MVYKSETIKGRRRARGVIVVRILDDGVGDGGTGFSRPVEVVAVDEVFKSGGCRFSSVFRETLDSAIWYDIPGCHFSWRTFIKRPPPTTISLFRSRSMDN